MRNKILSTIVATLEPLDFVLALWQGGSAAHGYTDRWSDLDIEVVVEDNSVETTFDIAEKALKTIAEIEFKYRVPEPTWHGHSQCFYQLKGASPFLAIDFAVMKRSSPNDFLDIEIHGNPVIAFDKANLVVPTNLDLNQHFLRMKQRLDELKVTFNFRQTFVKKEINRGHLVEAVSRYHTYTLQPLLELLGMVYRPYRYDFKNAKYFNRDFPNEVIVRMEPLYCVINLSDLGKKQQVAELMFAEILPRAEAAVQMP